MEDAHSFILKKDSGWRVYISCYNYISKHFDPNPYADKNFKETTIPQLSLQEAKERGWIVDENGKCFCPECTEEIYKLLSDKGIRGAEAGKMMQEMLKKEV